VVSTVDPRVLLTPAVVLRLSEEERKEVVFQRTEDNPSSRSTPLWVHPAREATRSR